ncbi:MAG TPA: TonB family protein [Candidatus Koribacter sp.]
MQAIGVAVLLNLTWAAPKMMEKARYETITLTAPVEQAKVTPAPKVKVVQPKVKVEPTPTPIQPQQVKIQPPPMPTRIPRPAPVQEAKIEAPAPKFDAPRIDLPPGPKPAKPIHTNNFGSTGSSATPTLANKNANEVQTGGFGDPNGVPASDNHTGKVAIAKLGSFDLPEGAGQGNGTGGGKGARGTVVSSGFGNGTAVQGGGGRGTGGTGSGRVVQTAFNTPQPAAPTTAKKTVSEDSGFTPFTILSKPKPTYTDEGRKRHIEGEVQLDVVFMANGQLKVLGVTRGLGYGLDEAAIQAAQKIQFVPAKRGGQPVDYQAKLRILFQLT